MEPRTTFVGREPELAMVDGLVRSTRLVTIAGAGGIGKTRLSLRLVDRLRHEAADGVFIVELADLPPGSGEPAVAELVLGALDRSSMEVATRWLAEATVLIVLDNCEHVLDGAAAVAAALADAGPEVRVLATSRAPLEIADEHVVLLEPLSPSDSLQLLRDRAAASGAVLDVDAATDVELHGLCERLDGMPLAVEMAASRLRSMGPADVRAGLESSPSLLRRARSADPRHRSIADVVAWSYELLDDDGRSLFRALSVFPGWFQLDDVVALLGDDGRNRMDVFDGLDRLVAQSLLRATTERGRMRYRLLVPVRQLAREWCDEAGDAERLEGRMLDVLAGRALDIATRGLSDFGDDIMTAVFDTAVELRAAARRCIEIDEGPDRAFLLFQPSYGVVHHRDVAAIARLGEELLDRWPEPDWPLAGEVRAIVATAHLGIGDHDALRRRAEEVASIDPGRSLAAVVAERAVALAALNRGAFDEAIDRVSIASTWADELGLDTFRIELDSHRGGMLDAAGRHEEARRYLLAALDESRAAEDTVVVVATLSLLADHHLDHEPDIAAGYLDELDDVMVDYHQLDTSWSGQITRGYHHLQNGDTGAAAAAMGEALRSAYAAGDRRDTWRAVRGVGVIAVLDGGDGPDGASLIAAVDSNPVATPIGAAGRREYDLACAAAVRYDTAPVADPIAFARDLAARLSDRDRDSVAPTSTAGADPAPRLTVAPTLVSVEWRGERCELRPMKGLHDLVLLLRSPGRELHVLELVGSTVDEADTGPTVDATARRNYEDRLRALQIEIHEAEDNNDLGRVEHLQREFDAVVTALSEGLGLGGRDRKVGASAEKARQAVTWRLRAAIKRIEAELPSCGRHLRNSVKTGAFCRYEPEVDPGWVVSD